jgi:hypothetical protein
MLYSLLCLVASLFPEFPWTHTQTNILHPVRKMERHASYLLKAMEGVIYLYEIISNRHITETNNVKLASEHLVANDVYYESTRAIQPHSVTYPYTKSVIIFHLLLFILSRLLIKLFQGELDAIRSLSKVIALNEKL